MWNMGAGAKFPMNPCSFLGCKIGGSIVAKSSKSQTEAVSVDQTAPESFDDSVSRWHRAEEDVLIGKMEDAKAKVKALEEKLQAWRELNPKQRKRKCLTKMRSTFAKPDRLLNRRLKESGDDILKAVGEGLMMYRINRLIDSYSKTKSKLEEAVETATQISNDYPDMSEVAGGFDWKEQVPNPREEDGSITVLTSDGKKTGKIVEGEDEK